MKNTILKFLISRGGAIAAPIAAAIIAAVAVKIDPFSHELAEQLRGPEAVGWLTAFIIAILSAWANGNQRKGAKAVQEILRVSGQDEVQVDGVIGPVTVSGTHLAAGVPPTEKPKRFRLRWPWGRE